jgi:hypothetical protein
MVTTASMTCAGLSGRVPCPPMGSDRASHDNDRTGTTVSDAARILGISEGAVRKRVERGKLAADRGPDGRLIVFLEEKASDTTATDTTHDRTRQSRDQGDRYTRSLEEQAAYLRSQLDQEREANRENRRIIAALTSRIPELEAPAQAERGSPETVEDESQMAEPRPDAGGAQRPWWRRVFGR